MCSRDFPDLESQVLAAADRLNAEPAQITVTLPDGEKVNFVERQRSDAPGLVKVYATPKVEGFHATWMP